MSKDNYTFEGELFILSPAILSVQVDKENLTEPIWIQADKVAKVYLTAADPRQASSGLGGPDNGQGAGVLFDGNRATLNPAVVSLTAKGVGQFIGNGHESFPVDRGGIASDAPSMTQNPEPRNPLRGQFTNCHNENI